MSNETLSLADLTKARSDLLVDVENAKANLAAAESKLANLNVLIHAFEKYAGLAEESSEDGKERQYSFTIPRAQFESVERPVVPSRRIASTQMVSDLLRKADSRLTREEIRERFKETFGFPASWKNPPNAVNNAIARAVGRGLIKEFPDGTYASIPGEVRSW